MPIRPEMRPRYPKNWRDISAHVRFVRAGGRCECVGECGTTHVTDDGRCAAMHGRAHPDSKKVVRLTVGHRNHRPEDNDPELLPPAGNLRAWCERCHLGHDRRHHVASRRWNRAAELRKAGQLELPWSRQLALVAGGRRTG